MALVKASDKDSVSKWAQRDKRATRHKLPEDAERPLINYTRLRELISIDGLSDRDNPNSTNEAHEEFMLNYSDMFVKPAKKKGLPFHSLERCTQKSSEMSLLSKSAGDKTTTSHRHRLQKKYPADELSHNIGDYLGTLRHERKRDHPADVMSDRLKTIRRLLKKLPFERSAVENDQLFACLKQFECLSSQVSSLVLKELCVMAYLDQWKENEVTVFGNTGWHLILRGSVKPLASVYHKVAGEELEVRSPTPESEETDSSSPLLLQVGDCFGTLDKVEENVANSRLFTVLTNEANCDFLKISCNDYKRVMEQIHHRDRTEKVNLLQSCKTFELWSRQPLMEVANLLVWSTYPANTVLVSEGYKSPFIGVIKTGECHILRQVEVKHALPNGTEEHKVKQVVMGKLSASHSFGEISCIEGVPMSCSIITATACEIGCVHLEKVKELNETTCQLLHQSSEPTFGNLGPDDIHEEYVQQELKREWNEFKHQVVVDVINHRGIRPGYGKWAKS